MLELLLDNKLLLVLLAVWTLPWKGYSLWKAARLGDKVWFVVLLVINTVGILEIIYIFFVSKKREPVKGNDIFQK
ncbi:MAG: DUF5652 family protein [Patescibacteria group bacterium]